MSGDGTHRHVRRAKVQKARRGEIERTQGEREREKGKDCGGVRAGVSTEEKAVIYARGSELPQAKLNDKLVARIRRLHARKERLKRLLDARYSAGAFAAKFGVHKHTINKVLTYATWRHVKE